MAGGKTAKGTAKGGRSRGFDPDEGTEDRSDQRLRHRGWRKGEENSRRTGKKGRQQPIVDDE